jgi:hypothetical protein
MPSQSGQVPRWCQLQPDGARFVRTGRRRGPLAGRLDAGESIKALASYLGHADSGFTLRVYTHLMPASEERTRRAIDDLFRDTRPASDGLNAIMAGVCAGQGRFPYEYPAYRSTRPSPTRSEPRSRLWPASMSGRRWSVMVNVGRRSTP